MIEEQELIIRVLAGQPEAEDRFYKMFQPRLLRASIYFLGTHDPEAEDIVQETFIVALPKLRHYDFRAPIYAWLRQICLRLCYARMRKRTRELMSIEEDLEVFMRRMAMERVETQDLEMVKKARLDLLTEMKKQLNPDSAQIIEMRNVQGMTYIQISRALELPLGTVMSRLARARDQLRTLLEGKQGKAFPAG
jgi:RNA polymerase sigma-70 factor (ECF subfamily)